MLAAAGPIASTAAQEAPLRAILETGPTARRGIDALAPDLTPHWHARYRVGALLLDLAYVTDPLLAPETWPRIPCQERQLRGPDGRLVYYRHPTGWALVVEVFAGDFPDGVTACRFVDRFVREHLLFEGLEAVRRVGDAPRFPAIIELE